MARKRSWTDKQLRDAVAASTSMRQVAQFLGEPGWRDEEIAACIERLALTTRHFADGGAERRALDRALRTSVPQASSAAELLGMLGMTLERENYSKVRKRILAMNLDTSHFRRAVPRHAGRRRRWDDAQLREAVASEISYAGVIRRLGLIAAGGNYVQVQRRIQELGLDTTHFRGRGWNVAGKYIKRVSLPLSEILVRDRWCGSHTLKQRLIREGLKEARCELCGWANCHALQPTHRGLNKRSVRK